MKRAAFKLRQFGSVVGIDISTDLIDLCNRRKAIGFHMPSATRLM